MLLESLEVDPVELHARTGWALKPEGLCKGPVCAPLPPEALTNSRIKADTLVQRLGMALVADEEHGRWALGPESGGRALTTAQAPDLELPRLDGTMFRLSSLRGHKVVVAAWASW
ncbi:MAG: peroxiredoxin family protein [Acidimicrobiales bacterium]